MITNDKKDLIIRLYLEGKNYDEITGSAHASGTTVTTVIKEYENSKTKSEETIAFEKFDQGLHPVKGKIESNIAADKIAKSYLAYNKMRALVDLFDIYKDLGNSMPDFVAFYKEAKLKNITVPNMSSAMDLASNTWNLEQKNMIAATRLQDTNRAIDAANGTLAEVQWQATAIDRANIAKRQEAVRLQSEIDVLKSTLEKLKNFKEYQKVERIIQNSINSITAVQSLTIELAVMAVVKKIQSDPSIIPVIMTISPDLNQGLVDPTLRQTYLATLISQAMQFMPQVQNELMELTAKQALPHLRRLADWSRHDNNLEEQGDTPTTSTNKSETDTIMQERVQETAPIEPGKDVIGDPQPDTHHNQG